MSNINHNKKHLLRCSKFLNSKEAKGLASKERELRDAMVAQGITPPSAAAAAGSSGSITVSSCSGATPAQAAAGTSGSGGGSRKRPMSSFIDNVTAEEKAKIDGLLTKALVLTGTEFCWLEHPAVVELFQALRPAYQLPSR